ncbi:MAG: hypothetical protein ACREF8_05530 [Chthoniobacterales bacterium]
MKGIPMNWRRSTLGLFFFFALSPELIQAIARSGRVLSLAESPSSRIAPPGRIAPGAPPLLSFRLYEGKMRGQFSNSDLMMDDAGH